MVPHENRLFYIMGASGSGKDTLIRCVRPLLQPGAPIRFARRYITRPEELDGEKHIAVTKTAFDRLLGHGCFAMHWTSHGLRYGIGTEIDRWLENGLNVVVNGSRQYFSKAARTYAKIVPLLIHVSEPLLRERLVRRGRESLEEIERRLAREHDVSEAVQHSRLIIIDNNGPLERACERLMDIFTSRSTL